MPRLQLPMKMAARLVTMTLMMTSVVAQGGSSNAVGVDLPCREVLPGDNVDTCYTLYRSTDTDNRKSYSDAEKVCSRNHGDKGRLVTIPNLETQRWLEDALNEKYDMNAGQLWIGAKYVDNGWTWHGREMYFTNWANGQPVNDPNRSGFIETYRNAAGETYWKWMTDRSASLKDYICEYIDNRCGRPHHEPTHRNRVSGGTEANEHSWPWMVSIQNSHGHVCGGIVINDGMILTAAHCQDKFYYDRERTVLLGIHNLREGHPHYTIEAHVGRTMVHHRNNKNLTNSNDLMLIELEEPITFNHGVKPVCLPPNNQAFPEVGRRCIATGWGTHNDTSQCCPMWVAQRDTKLEIDGRSHILKKENTLYNCQYSCFQRAGCEGINFHYNEMPGRRCVAILSSSSQRYTPAVGVDHFSIRRRCAGCRDVLTVYENRALMSNNVNSTVFDVESQYDCQLNCTIVTCDGFNYQELESVGLPNRCELLFRLDDSEEFPREELMMSSSSNHYEVKQFFLRDYDYNLRQIILPIVSQQQCRRLYPNRIDNSMMCAGSLNGGADTCKGDSGGPLVCEEPDGSWMLYGVTSWGEPDCTLSNKPGVYAKVAPHVDWIKSKMRASTRDRSPTTTPGPSVESTSQQYSCDTNNPCSPENVQNGWRCYTSSDPNPNKFIFCTTRGRCLPKDGSTMPLNMEEDLCYFAIRRMRDIAKNEGGTSGFRINIRDHAK